MGILHLTPKRLKNVKQSDNSDHLMIRDFKRNFNYFTIVSKIPIILIYLSRSGKPILNKTVKSVPLELFE